MSGSRAAPLLLLPGLLCDASIWPRAALDLTHPVIAPMGYGTADSLEQMAAIALEAAPGRLSLLGHSMGARVALEIFRQAPERVERLALVSTGIHAPKPGEAAARHALLDLGRTEGPGALVDRWLPPMVAAARRQDSALIDPLRAMCVHAGVDVFAAQITALLGRPPVEALLGSIACPTLVLVGSEDEWSTPAQHRDIAAAIPGAELMVIQGSGHMLPAEAPEAFVDAVRHWLAFTPVPAATAEHQSA